MSKVVINEKCSPVVTEGIPTKMGDPRRLPFPFEFGNATKTYALADYEPSINLMPFLFYQTLNLPELKNTRMAVHMVD